MIHFDKVSKIYLDKSVALEEVSFSIDPKEFVSIVGHSGAGKTTLVKMILGEGIKLFIISWTRLQQTSIMLLSFSY